jgi:hypothetical protein
MRIRTLLQALRRPALGRRVAAAALAVAGLGATACNNDVDITDPNAPGSGTFWVNREAADAGVVAVYNGLLRLGTGQRWWAFGNDLRSDIGTVVSPWGELQAFSRFQFPSGYDFEVNRELWIHNYELIQRANQVTANVPAIQMADTTKNRMLGEAQFLRGMAYFNLITLFGGAGPADHRAATTTDRPGAADSAACSADRARPHRGRAALPSERMSPRRAGHGGSRRAARQGAAAAAKWAGRAPRCSPSSRQYGATTLSRYAPVPPGGNNGRSRCSRSRWATWTLCGQGICG